MKYEKTNIKSRSEEICPALGRNRIAQAIEPKGEERMTTETNYQTPDLIGRQSENKTELLRLKTGYGQHASPLHLYTALLQKSTTKHGSER
jgi:hypothetical protein